MHNNLGHYPRYSGIIIIVFNLKEHILGLVDYTEPLQNRFNYPNFIDALSGLVLAEFSYQRRTSSSCNNSLDDSLLILFQLVITVLSLHFHLSEFVAN